VVVDRDGKRLFRVRLADNVTVEELADLVGLRQLFEQPDVSALMGVEGKMRERYYQAWRHILTGDWDFVAIVRVREHGELAELVTERLSKLPGITRTRTMVAFEAYSRHDLESMFSVGDERD